ncbi:hypothetical protein BLA29_003657 [Euroglyphus maynei]|uniref:Secreted protein n=1 Tax=Euroglyphus maynei TaxID=6958 RepID=A0A1Y3BHL5_EURMA|nr:hypothetical protein BLA29_003657 [Euroglyphus maynei]
MPFGLSWSSYLTRVMAALAATFCESHVNHFMTKISIFQLYFHPPQRIEQMLETKKAELEQQPQSSSSTTTKMANQS